MASFKVETLTMEDGKWLTTITAMLLIWHRLTHNLVVDTRATVLTMPMISCSGMLFLVASSLMSNMMSLICLPSCSCSSSCCCRSRLAPWLAFQKKMRHEVKLADSRKVLMNYNSMGGQKRCSTCALWSLTISERPFSSNTALKWSSVRLLGGKNSINLNVTQGKRQLDEQF